MYNKGKIFVWTAVVCTTVSLLGCGAQYIRDDAQGQINAGDYEKGLKTYETGLQRYPDNVTLLLGQASAHDAIFARMTTMATAARAAGKDELAQETLRRALEINPNDERAKAMLLDIDRDHRQKVALAAANELLTKGLREQATLAIESALKDNPTNADLLALQRKLELEDKQTESLSRHLTETRPISLDFRDANLRNVLEVLTRTSGVNFIIDKDVRQDLRATIFLRQTRLEDALQLITATNQLAYKILDTATVLVYPRTAEKLKEYQDLVIRAFYLSNADVKQTAALLKTMLKIREPYTDEKLNLIMIRETPETIRLAERLIALHDMPEPEVMMELEVLEIQRSSLTTLGIQYPDTLTLTPLLPSGATNFTLGNLKGINSNSIGINIPNLTVNLHSDDGNVNILANPKIRARNREKAKIVIGDKLPIVTTTGSVSNSGFISESVQYVDVGLKLNVEPNIYLDDEVAIKVGLEVSSLEQEIKTTAGSLVYQIGTRTADTVLRLHDGETQLLAGLINNQERSSANRIPGLGDMPILGHLFSSQSNNGQRSEIVLSITPHIIRNIRRPDLNQTEFWSGTENDMHSRPFTLYGAKKNIQEKNTQGNLPATQITATAGVNPIIPSTLSNISEQQTSASLKLTAPTEVKIGDTFSVQVELKTDIPLRGMPVQLKFNQKILETIDADEGAFFKQDGAIISKTKALEQNEGRVSAAILRTQAEGIKGEGTIMTFKFKAVSAGSGEIRLIAAKGISIQPVTIAEFPAAIKIMVK